MFVICGGRQTKCKDHWAMESKGQNIFQMNVIKYVFIDRGLNECLLQQLEFLKCDNRKKK